LPDQNVENLRLKGDDDAAKAQFKAGPSSN